MLRRLAYPPLLPAVAQSGIRPGLDRGDHLDLRVSGQRHRRAVGRDSRPQLVGDSSATVYEVVEASIRQSFVADSALGRVGSTFRVADVLVQLLAMVAGAFLAEAMDVRTAVTLAPLGAVVAAIILWASPARRLRVLPAAKPAS
jgi:hypothetical protein